MTPAIDVMLLCADTDAILADWVETLTIQRVSVVYDAEGKATETWAVVETFEGDWQAPSGDLIYDEAGLVVPNDGVVFGECSIDVEVGDRIVQSDDSYMLVVYVAVHEGHNTIFLKEPERGSISVALTPTEAGYKTEITQDTDTILQDWYETVTVKNRTIVYDAAGAATTTYVKLGTIVGDWQPVSGTLPREESGQTEHSVAQIITRPDVSVSEDDQIVRQDGAVYYVNYVRRHEDHCTIRLKRSEGQEE